MATLVQKQVAVTIWKLITTDCYKYVDSLFGVEKSTVGKAAVEFSESVRRVVYPKVVGIQKNS